MPFPTRSLAALVLAASLPAGADELTIVSRVTRNGGPPVTTTSYLGSDHARMVQPDGQEMILDSKAGQMTIIDGRKKEYFVITRQDIEQVQARVQQQMNSPEMRKAQEQMKNLPPDVQKRMEAMMGGVTSSINVRKTGTTRKIAGYSCEDWTIDLGQFSKTEECLTTELPLPAQSWETYRSFAQTMKSMMAAAGPMAKAASQMQEKFKEMKGLPLATKTTASILGHSSTTLSEVTEVKRGPIPASAWEIPAGYRKVENPMLKAAAAK